ncbi:hypothetical protein Caci_2145 [Catenulispora acidiphila DSM 44928]|uniref:Uncharacterized protein n=1 Tax=Catenulispora acidiphila (strain DSM 44928 / JCM 14897 / NBRC 102108 / NRRL B-24433 / ID139908) TaxID=479433 RepID=C7QHN9_CATAD|nr:hypothetical protein Caci_2145 [Catenulispora acidiphila DSM 44928]
MARGHRAALSSPVCAVGMVGMVCAVGVVSAVGMVGGGVMPREGVVT